ncbi:MULTISPECIES: formate dehydrogenase [unclassified Mesorhizobium]|uniref:formate dehydrogenase n=1 Tax=unclassified Mesorhizobium TaxID=325217 RepID=UPI000FE454D7|nr:MULTISPECIES: formate dehydrogenase [unclassified Mesorhizobium]RWI23975.1 MAG: formate dehydrogenase [Mesorhizobium sp.]RWK51502.1 MAG: formate dehydrogenase [Mesorhizobium sp.]RWK96188.1 MAG: formate dehydrogenase [Mesorhizobium sp.]RWL00166.1 MAG: formate dehydrogenase [Mesorhizobium sp.]TIP57729.1 MAG: formate dehydrogenase [Mesorhizobium sp.]
MQENKQTAMNRRNFLRAFGGASTTAVAAAAVALTPGEAQAYDPGEEETRARYRETEHVKAFYRVNGYETLKK